MRGRCSAGGEHASKSELVIAAGLGLLGKFEYAGGNPQQVVVAVPGGCKLFDRRLELPQHPLSHADIGLLADTAQDKGEEVTGGDLGIAGHVPGCPPDDRAR